MFSETWGASGEQRLGQFGREDSTDDAQISGWDSSGGQVPGPSPPDCRTEDLHFKLLPQLANSDGLDTKTVLRKTLIQKKKDKWKA